MEEGAEGLRDQGKKRMEELNATSRPQSLSPSVPQSLLHPNKYAQGSVPARVPSWTTKDRPFRIAALP